MSRDTGDRMLIISALVVAAIYGYRRLSEATEPGVSLPRLVGLGAPAPLASWVTAWGSVFFGLSIVGSFAPEFAGSFGVLIATSDVLTNGMAVFGDLSTHSTPPAGSSSPSATSSTGNRKTS